jgi:hypothetical protein
LFKHEKKRTGERVRVSMGGCVGVRGRGKKRVNERERGKEGEGDERDFFFKCFNEKKTLRVPSTILLW